MTITCVAPRDVKPDVRTSLASVRLAALALEASIPAGALSLMTGTGSESGLTHASFRNPEPQNRKARS